MNQPQPPHPPGLPPPVVDAALQARAADAKAKAHPIAPFGMVQAASIAVARPCFCGAFVRLSTTPFSSGLTLHLCLECHETEESLAYWVIGERVAGFALVGRA